MSEIAGDQPAADEHEIAYAPGALDDGTDGQRAYCVTCAALARDYVEDCAVIGESIAAHNRGAAIAGDGPPAACTTPGHDHGAEDYPDEMAAAINAEHCQPGDTDAPAPMDVVGRAVGAHRDLRPGVREVPDVAPDVHLREVPGQAVPVADPITGVIDGVTGYTLAELRERWAHMRARPEVYPQAEMRLACMAVGLANQLQPLRDALVHARDVANRLHDDLRPDTREAIEAKIAAVADLGGDTPPAAHTFVHTHKRDYCGHQPDPRGPWCGRPEAEHRGATPTHLPLSEVLELAADLARRASTPPEVSR